MIAIVNVSSKGPNKNGNCTYELRINRYVITRFEHNRDRGLAECLRAASEAAKKQELADFVKVMDMFTDSPIVPKEDFKKIKEKDTLNV